MEIRKMEQLKPLTGLRGIAAYSVLIAHGISTAFYYNGGNSLQPIAGRIAYFGVSLFFVLSGFVIYYNYAKLIRSEGIISGGYQFMVARFARLFPLYALVIFFSLDSIPSGYFLNKEWGVAAYATMTQSWFNMQDITFEPAWSISTEWFFYFSFLILIPVFEKIHRPIITLVLFLAIVFLFLPGLMEVQLRLSSPVITRGWVIYYSPLTRIFEFIAGVLASKIFLSKEERQRKIHILEFITMLLCIMWCVMVIFIDPLKSGKYANLLSNFIFAPAIAPLLIFCCRFDTFISRIFSSRLLMFIGEISYSAYLLQFWILTALSGSYIPKVPPEIYWVNPLIKIAAITILTTMMAYGSYHLFEMPCRKFLRKFLTFRGRKKMIRDRQAAISGIVLSGIKGK